MTALSADRNTQKRDGKQFAYPCAASKTFYAGAIVFLDTSGNAEPATTATGKICAGVAQKALVSTTAAAEKIDVQQGVFKFVNGETITKAHIGDICYADDDQTVMRTSTGRSAVGAIVDVESDGVWVSINAPLTAPSTGLTVANNLSDVGTLATAQSNLGLTDSTLDANLDTTTFRPKLVAGGAAYTVGSAADGDATVATATDNSVITLPNAAASNAGQRVIVQNQGADGAAKVSISPHSSDKIKGGVHGAATGDLVSFSGNADKDAINTKATAKAGDYLILQCDGVDTWWVIGGKGVWASEP
jgi:hypothetical protein